MLLLGQNIIVVENYKEQEQSVHEVKVYLF
jgi:hypothetical protein